MFHGSEECKDRKGCGEARRGRARRARRHVPQGSAPEVARLVQLSNYPISGNAVCGIDFVNAKEVESW